MGDQDQGPSDVLRPLDPEPRRPEGKHPAGARLQPGSQRSPAGTLHSAGRQPAARTAAAMLEPEQRRRLSPGQPSPPPAATGCDRDSSDFRHQRQAMCLDSRASVQRTRGGGREIVHLDHKGTRVRLSHGQLRGGPRARTPGRGGERAGLALVLISGNGRIRQIPPMVGVS